MFALDFKLDTGDKNVGTVYLPHKDATDIPVIIYCHGWGGNRGLRPSAKGFCDRAIEENIAFVAFDFFGCGDTGGDYGYMTYARWKENLSDVVDWVAEQPFSAKNKIGCFAISSGTTAALRLAAENCKLSFIISVATCASAYFNMQAGGPAKILVDNLGSLVVGGTAKIFDIDFGLEFFVDTISNAPIHSVGRIQCPVLFLQGTADNAYRNADAKMAHDTMMCSDPGSKTVFAPIEGGDHSLDNAVDEAVNVAYEWLYAGYLV